MNKIRCSYKKRTKKNNNVYSKHEAEGVFKWNQAKSFLLQLFSYVRCKLWETKFFTFLYFVSPDPLWQSSSMKLDR